MRSNTGTVKRIDSDKQTHFGLTNRGVAEAWRSHRTRKWTCSASAQPKFQGLSRWVSPLPSCRRACRPSARFVICRFGLPTTSLIFEFEDCRSAVCGWAFRSRPDKVADSRVGFLVLSEEDGGKVVQSHGNDESGREADKRWIRVQKHQQKVWELFSASKKVWPGPDGKVSIYLLILFPFFPSPSSFFMAISGKFKCFCPFSQSIN